MATCVVRQVPGVITDTSIPILPPPDPEPPGNYLTPDGGDILTPDGGVYLTP